MIKKGKPYNQKFKEKILRLVHHVNRLKKLLPKNYTELA